MKRGEAEFVAKTIGGASELIELFAASGLEEIELLAAVGERGEADAEETDLAARIAMAAEEIEEGAEDVGIEVNGFRKRVGAGMRVEASVANGEGEGASGEASFAEALAGFLREMAEERFHLRDIEGVFAESVILGNGFGLGVDQEFVGIAAAGFAIESGAPLAKDFFEAFLGIGGELLDGLNTECVEGAFGDFADAGNFSDMERSEETCFLTGNDPDEAAGLGLIGSDLGHQAGGG